MLASSSGNRSKSPRFSAAPCYIPAEICVDTAVGDVHWPVVSVAIAASYVRGTGPGVLCGIRSVTGHLLSDLYRWCQVVPWCAHIDSNKQKMLASISGNGSTGF